MVAQPASESNATANLMQPVMESWKPQLIELWRAFLNAEGRKDAAR